MDRFKAINDSLGHPAGDQLIQVIGARLSECVRETDTVTRWSGDEFIILLPDLGSEQSAVVQSALVVAEKIWERLAQPVLVESHEILVTCSLGIALYPWDADNATDLVKHADTAMYRAKELGRNNFQFYTAFL